LEEELIKMNNKKILTILYFSVVTISIVTLINPTINYMYFYKAIENLELYISDFHFNATEETASFVLVIANREPYSGLQLTSLRYRLKALSGNDELDLLGGQLWWEPTFLAPISNFTWLLTDQPIMKSGAEFLKKSFQERKPVTLIIEGEAIIITFVGYGSWIYFTPNEYTYHTA